MALFAAETKGTIEVAVSDDIADRLEQRAESGGLLGAGSRDRYRVERILVPTATPYRTGQSRPAGVRIVELGGRSTATPLEDVTLMFEPDRVRYVVKFPRWQGNGLVAGALLGSMLVVVAVWFVALKQPTITGLMMAIAAIAQLILWRSTRKDARVKAHQILERILVEETERARVRVASESETEAESETESETESGSESARELSARGR